MDSNKTKLIIMIVFIILIVCVVFAVNKDSKNSQLNVEESENVTISYEVDYVTDTDNEGKTVYEIKDSDGRTIGTTEDPDEIRLYEDNPSYGEYAPSITE